MMVSGYTAVTTKLIKEVKTMTNYERIKQMSVEEMVRFLESIRNDFYGRIIKINGYDIWDSFNNIEEWLESEVDGNG